MYTSTPAVAVIPIAARDVAVGITATAGVLVYIAHGELKPAYGVLLGIPAAGGAFFGTGLQQRLPVRTLSFLFALLLFAIAIRMLLQ